MRKDFPTDVLDRAAARYAAQLMLPDRPHPTIEGRYLGGPSWVAACLFDADFKDEHEYLVGRLMDGSLLGSEGRAALEELAKQNFTKRDPKVFEALLKERLAVDLNGDHIEGFIGKVEVGTRIVNRVPRRLVGPRTGLAVEGMFPEFWPIYMGEGDERSLPGGGVADPLPDTAEALDLGAAVSRINNAIAIVALDALLDQWDAGTSNAVIQFRSGAAPATVETAATGTLAATLAFSDPAFAGATDQNPDAQAAAASITSDTSADATVTVGYGRNSTTNDGSTPITALQDVNAGETDECVIFNTADFVSGAQVDLTSYTQTLPEVGA